MAATIPVTARVWATAALSIFLATALNAQPVPPDSPVAAQLKAATAAVDAIVAIPEAERTFDNTIGALDDMAARLDRDTSLLLFMAYVSTDAEERRIAERAQQDVLDWSVELNKREDLYRAVKALADRKPALDPVQQRLLNFTLRDFRRAGMELGQRERDQLKEIEKQITTLSIDFERNIREDQTRIPFTLSELAGAPESVIGGLPKVDDIVLVGLDTPTYVPLMERCTQEQTRKKLFLAYRRRAGTKNVALIEKIIRLRAQAAQLLGYTTPADYEIEVRMAKNPAAVRDFFAKLTPLVEKKTRLDYAEYQNAKREHTGDPSADLQPWDAAFYKQYLLEKKYAVDSEKVREYFPFDAVMKGLFSITQQLYGLEYRDVTAQGPTPERPLWHPDVRRYEVWDKARNEMLGEFYIDLFPRENKFTHAAQWPLVVHKIYTDGTRQKPLAALVCNFTKPEGDKPSLMKHDEVETFFHEFGHCLHTLLSESRYARFSGTSVARDFVEAPSQMFENWIWDADVVNTFARHYQTGEPLPAEVLDGMIRAKNLGSGLETTRQIFYAMTDMAYHTVPDGVVDTTRVQAEVFEAVEPYDPVPNTFFQAAFGHLTGYQAGYYSYLWSLVYAQDMFQRFRELGMLNPQAGAYYREHILSRGSTLDEMDLVREYLGREPRMDAFLEHLGLQADAQ